MSQYGVSTYVYFKHNLKIENKHIKTTVESITYLGSKREYVIKNIKFKDIDKINQKELINHIKDIYSIIGYDYLIFLKNSTIVKIKDEYLIPIDKKLENPRLSDINYWEYKDIVRKHDIIFDLLSSEIDSEFNLSNLIKLDDEYLPTKIKDNFGYIDTKDKIFLHSNYSLLEEILQVEKIYLKILNLLFNTNFKFNDPSIKLRREHDFLTNVENYKKIIGFTSNNE